MPETALRIALLTHSVNPRGGVVHTLELADALHALGHAVTVIAPALPGQRFFRTPRCAVDLVPVRATPRELAALVASRRDACVAHLSARYGPGRFDVWHAHDGIGGNALATLQEQGVVDGFVRTVHHLDDFADAQVMQWQRRAVERAAQVFCVSRGWCDTLRRDYGIEADLVHNGVDLRRYGPAADAGDARVAQRYGLRAGAPRLLAVGGIEARKNTVRILQAYAALRQVRPQAQLVIAGGASLLDHGRCTAEFTAVLSASGLAVGPGQPVVITGPVPDEDMPALFRAADALLMPSLCEGFGLVVLEALASGTPVVVSRGAPFTEYLAPDEAGVFWADPLSPESIAAAALQASAPEGAAAIAGAVPAVCRRHDWTASAARHVALYRARHPRHAPAAACAAPAA